MPSRSYRFKGAYRCPECGKMYFYPYYEGHKRITCPYCGYTTTKSRAQVSATLSRTKPYLKEAGTKTAKGLKRFGQLTIQTFKKFRSK